MRLAKCKWCGKPFQSFGIHFCPQCVQELDEQYKPVRDYIYDHPHACIEEVMEATGVDQRVILYYLRDGRLEMVNAGSLLRCEQCGAPVNSGRLCAACTGKVEERIIKPLQARMAQRREEAKEGEGRVYTSQDRGRMYTYQDRIRDRSK